MIPQPLLSICIVVYQLNESILKNVLEHLKIAVDALSLPPGRVKLYIINNNPNKNMPALQIVAEEYPSLAPHVIQNSSNAGYGVANNQAITETKATYHLVLNPDVYIDLPALKAAINYMQDHPEVGLLCPAIFGEDGQRHYVHRQDPTLWDLVLRGLSPRFLKKLFKNRMENFELHHTNWEIEQDILSPSGCCLLFRTSLFEKIKGFDPDYFLYYEDSDIGRRARQYAKVKYLPDFKVTHLWAREGHKTFKMKWQLIKSGLIYLRKWGGWF